MQMPLEQQWKLDLGQSLAEYTFDLRSNQRYDEIVDGLVSTLKLTNQARKRDIPQFPKYNSIFKSSTEVYVEAEAKGQTLRQLMYDRDYMKKHGQDIVVAFFHAYKLL